MKILFLGTAGPDQIPSPYCDCPQCTHARINGGKDVRKRCGYLINDDLLVDMSADLLVACHMHNVHLMNVTHALVTHSHHDHFYPENIAVRQIGFPNQKEIPRLTLVAPPSVMALLQTKRMNDKRVGLKRHPILPFEEADLGNYHVKALRATHQHNIGDAVNYLIDHGGKRVLIASDTAVYRDEVWPHLKDKQLDHLIIECAVGVNEANKGGKTRHLSVEGVREMLNKMRDMGAVHDDTEIIATHFVHKHCLPHKEMEKILGEIGVTCAYDGLVVNV